MFLYISHEQREVEKYLNIQYHFTYKSMKYLVLNLTKDAKDLKQNTWEKF